MLAGRKLLLADDSITIQKVVDLTFADEGVQVIAVNNGAEAVARLQEVAPDVVLADVLMPGMSGYRLCEYIKRNEELKHIPVMLLVGSFEPFDEAEARRVGADDTLTKPFQSIRNLIDKVSALLGRETAADQSGSASVNQPDQEAVETSQISEEEGAKTLELPKPEAVHEAEEPMSTGELTISTADTKPLTPEMLAHVTPTEAPEVGGVGKVAEEETMESQLKTRPEYSEALGETLLDLDYAAAAPAMDDDSTLR